MKDLDGLLGAEARPEEQSGLSDIEVFGLATDASDPGPFVGHGHSPRPAILRLTQFADGVVSPAITPNPTHSQVVGLTHRPLGQGGCESDVGDHDLDQFRPDLTGPPNDPEFLGGNPSLFNIDL